MTVGDIAYHLKQHWPAIRERLLNGTYEPYPVRRVEIPKPDGGVRTLGIPTVLDRMIGSTEAVGWDIFRSQLRVGTAGRRAVLHKGVAVGGEYLKPNDATRTAAFTADSVETWTASSTQPHGYCSAVAYAPSTKTWITVGPNGTDISTDDGHNWHALTPSKDEPADADKSWNALSLPYVVGPHGRIGKLSLKALVP